MEFKWKKYINTQVKKHPVGYSVPPPQHVKQALTKAYSPTDYGQWGFLAKVNSWKNGYYFTTYYYKHAKFMNKIDIIIIYWHRATFYSTCVKKVYPRITEECVRMDPQMQD